MFKLFERIYAISPVWLQNLGISLFGVQWYNRRFGGVFKNELEKFRTRETYSSEQWKVYQNEELKKLLKHAFQHVPFYKESFLSEGIDENSLDGITVDNIHKLPFLEKNELRRFGKTTLVADITESGGQFFSSSGSTGTPTSILFSSAMHQKWSAGFEARIRNWAGIDRSEPRGMIGGRRILPTGEAKAPYYRFNQIENQVYFSAYHISPETASNYLEGIKKHNLSYMTGYAMSNYILAKFIRDQGLQAPQLKCVITSSEKLTDEMRAMFAEVYKCKTYDGWSGVEACGLISECEKGTLHISPDIGIVEVLKENGEPAGDGETGELVCTGLLNYDQPLIRYRIGDRVVVSNKKCECGRHMPVVSEIIGRNEDIIVGEDGREMVRFHGVFININSIVRGQIVQEKLGEIILNLETVQPLTEKEIQLVKSRVVSQLGNVSVTVHEVDKIEEGPNGKFRAVISRL